MTLTALLMLAMVLEADTALGATGSGSARAKIASAFRAFTSQPLHLGHPSPASQRQFFRLAEPSPTLEHAHTGVPELQGQGAVCKIRIMKADPTLDSGMVRTIQADQLDRIVRDDLAACTR